MPDALSGAVAACLGRHATAGQKLVAGLSGGIDSIALLHCLRELRSDRKLALSALHVHHGLSPHADAWEAHCRATCRAWDIPLRVERVEVERGSADGLEAAARRARHAVFQRSDGDWILLAHHRDDQAETLLFNLVRGAGIAGMAAMAEARGRLLRPMLGVARADIESYAAVHRLQWVEDESNADVRFSRNFLRRRVLTELQARFPGGARNLAAAAGRCAEAQQLLDELAREDLGPDCLDFPVPVGKLTVLSEVRARNALRYLLASRGVAVPSERRLREALRQLMYAAPDRHPAVRCGTAMLRRRGNQVVLE